MVLPPSVEIGNPRVLPTVSPVYTSMHAASSRCPHALGRSPPWGPKNPGCLAPTDDVSSDQSPPAIELAPRPDPEIAQKKVSTDPQHKQ